MPNITPGSDVIEKRLHTVSFFRTLSRDKTRSISAKKQVAHPEPGQILYAEGRLGDAKALIGSGSMKYSVATHSRQREMIVDRLGPGNRLDETGLVLDQWRPATVSVTIDGDRSILDRTDLDKALSESPKIALKSLRTLVLV